MGNYASRLPGGLNQTATGPDEGTSNRQCTPVPGPVCVEQSWFGDDWSTVFHSTWEADPVPIPLRSSDDLVNRLKENEHIIQVVPLDDLEKEYEELKAAGKFAAGMVSPVNDLATARKVIQELGASANQLYYQIYKGKKYVVFKGVPGTRNILKGTRYLVSNPKVVDIAIGPKGWQKAVKSGFKITFVLFCAIEVVDVVLNDEKGLADLVGTVSTDLVKVGLSSLAAAAVATKVGATAILGLGSVAAAPLLAAIAVGVVVGYGLDEIDARTGATAALIDALKEAGNTFVEVKDEAWRWYNYFETNPFALMRFLTYGP